MSLLRPFPIYGDEDLQENTQLTRDNYGIVAKVYTVVCEQDKMLKHDFQLFMIERNPPNDVKVIAGADHMSMFSQPQELFSYLQEIALLGEKGPFQIVISHVVNMSLLVNNSLSLSENWLRCFNGCRLLGEKEVKVKNKKIKGSEGEKRREGRSERIEEEGHWHGH
ncbi:hypothetical protein JHK85_030826 [Glycine max]|nr:hypothetical protein JHK85_030826 [Glycine max]